MSTSLSVYHHASRPDTPRDLGTLLTITAATAHASYYCLDHNCHSCLEFAVFS